MGTTRVSEPKQVGAIKVRKVTRDRKNYGRIEFYPEKKLGIYWTERRTDQFHQRERSWLFDCDTISAVRQYGVTHVGICVEDSTKLLIRVSAFGPEGMEQGVQRKVSNEYVDPRGRRGALCWYVPADLFAVSLPDDEVRQQAMLALMRLKRERITRAKVPEKR